VYYDNVEYAAKRLDNTLIRKDDGTPFFVYDTFLKEGKVVCVGKNMITTERGQEDLSGLDLTPVPLGFANLGGKMVFACRRPMRRDWKQGLSVNNLILYGADKQGFSFDALIPTILNNYPTFTECLTYVKKTRNRSMAFSRDFGLTSKEGGPHLIYRKYPVGTIIEGVPVLTPEKFFLEQHLSFDMRAA
jgi:hypothetical protein